MKLYGLKNCDTCRKALKALPQAELVDVRADGVPGDVLAAAQVPAAPDALEAVGKELIAAEQQLAAQRAGSETLTGKYTSLGEVYPRRSTGRRLALGRWIASRNNPRTARASRLCV